jgi:hypothetical protein
MGERERTMYLKWSRFFFAMNLLFHGTDNCVKCWLLWKLENGRIKVMDGTFTWGKKREKLSWIHSFHPSITLALSLWGRHRVLLSFVIQWLIICLLCLLCE